MVRRGLQVMSGGGGNDQGHTGNCGEHNFTSTLRQQPCNIILSRSHRIFVAFDVNDKG